MIPFRKFTLGLSALLALSSLVQAETRALECRFLALEEAPPALVNTAGEKNQVAVKVMRNRISDPMECYAVDGKLSFFDEKSGELLTSTAVPAKIKKAIFIFVKGNQGGKTAWKLFPIDNTEDSFPAGGTHVVNLHADEIRFILGQTKEVLKPNQSKGFEMPTNRDDFNMAPVAFQFKNSRDEWVNGKETSYRFLPTSRYLLVAYIDPRSSRPRVKTFKDTIRPRAAAQVR
ncbi:hypothetical protein AAFN60_07645 [Roseibacillus persicicus]|uniref:hypothetical protein n=1 Tax=Roseibacillus persicicus TaxID=454148 RepID=UPI00398B5275